MLPAIGPTPWQHRPDTSGNRAFFPQMLNCAKMIGMDPRVDADYLWIAEQARDELASRTLDVLYKDDGAKDKWWGSFAKRKFMQKELRA